MAYKTLEIDPDDQSYIVANVAADLAARNTTAQSVVCITTNVTVLEGPTIQSGLLVAKLQMANSDPNLPHTCTFRVTCANTERFDRTIAFTLADH
jgi:hypothetical protein